MSRLRIRIILFGIGCHVWGLIVGPDLFLGAPVFAFVIHAVAFTVALLCMASIVEGRGKPRSPIVGAIDNCSHTPSFIDPPASFTRTKPIPQRRVLKRFQASHRRHESGAHDDQAS